MDPVTIYVAENILLPHTQSVPSSFETLVEPSVWNNQFNVLDLNLDNAIYKRIPNLMCIDMFIGYITKDLRIQQLCVLVNAAPQFINICKHVIADKFKTYINNIGNDTYTWTQLSSKIEYSFYQFRKRKWPVKKENNVDWQTIAKKIGLVEKIYPGEGKKNETVDDLLTILNNKEKQAKKTEVIRELKSISNYLVYGIPDEKEIDLTEEEVVIIYDTMILLDQLADAILFICKLFVSRKYFHLVLKNIPFLTRITALMEKQKRLYPLIKYVMSYSFYLLHKEERLFGRRISKNNRAIFDEDEFRALPIFDGELDESPYFTEICSGNGDTNLSDRIVMLLGGKREFTDRKEFLHRLSVISGNMLTGIDLSEHGAFLTGSSLVPCVVTNPLEESFNGFNIFAEQYYPSYDSITRFREEFDYEKRMLIEMLIKSNTSYEEILDDDKFVEFSKTLPDHKEQVEKVLVVFNQLLKYESKLADLDIAITANSIADYDKKVFAIFEKIKKNINKHIYLYKQPVKYGTKWVLKGPGAKRPIDFFKINTPPHSLMFNFHVNVVRFWWNGQKIKALGSGVCAALSGVNQWYRWFSNNKDPMDIILKYMGRGYTTLLNQNEIISLRHYVSEVDKYRYIENSVMYGKIHKHHIIFGNEGGIRYQLSNYPLPYPISNNVLQLWSNPQYVLKRIGCSLCTNSHGKLISPVAYAFVSIINDLTD